MQKKKLPNPKVRRKKLAHGAPESVREPLLRLPESDGPEDGDLHHGDGGEDPARRHGAVGIQVTLDERQPMTCTSNVVATTLSNWQ